MQDSDEEKQLVQEVTDRARPRPLKKGNTYLVPQKFDDAGELLDENTFDARKHLKRLSLDDLRFLQAWRAAGWDTQKACDKLGVDSAQVKRVVAKLAAFRDEDVRTKSLAEIPTPAWISAKHVENIYDGGRMEDSQRDSLKELAKISGAYKTAATVNIQTNIFQMPRLTPEAAAKLKEFADAQADVIEGEIAA